MKITRIAIYQTDIPYVGGAYGWGAGNVIEAPCASWCETASLRSRCRLPILLDELIQSDADLIHAIATDACNGVGLKVSKQVGLTAMQRQRRRVRHGHVGPGHHRV